jgi:hypothetical protein
MNDLSAERSVRKSRYDNGKPGIWGRRRAHGVVLGRQILGLGRPADAIIIGGQRCGTRSLFQYLNQHPGVETAIRTEVHYFDVHYHRGPRWYAGHFRGEPGKVTVEASPYYIFSPVAAERIRRDLPDAKLIVLLRNPISRAYSHYRMMCDKNKETLTFEEALQREDERLAASELAYRTFSYRTRGIYADQLARWFAIFPRRQFHVAISDEMFSDGASNVDRICDFMGVERHRSDEYAQWNARTYPPISNETRESLEAFYRPHNQRLAELLDRALPW